MSFNHNKPAKITWPKATRLQLVKHDLRLLKKKIERMFDEDDKRLRLEKPLMDYLRLVHRKMDRKQIPLADRTVKLGKKSWPKQYKAGIDRLFGIDIEWVDGNV